MSTIFAVLRNTSVSIPGVTSLGWTVAIDPCEILRASTMKLAAFAVMDGGRYSIVLILRR
jgi:hypothetical protein